METSFLCSTRPYPNNLNQKLKSAWPNAGRVPCQGNFQPSQIAINRDADVVVSSRFAWLLLTIKATLDLASPVCIRRAHPNTIRECRIVQVTG